MLVNSIEMLADARKNRYAVVAPDIIDLDTARVFTETAEAEGCPLILSFAQVHCEMGAMSLEEAALVGRFVAEKSKMPVTLHLDHGTDEDFLYRAMDLGFTSVMLDASVDPFEKNAERTAAIVKYAHERGISVEAEIGHVGDGSSYNSESDSDSVYTTVEEAARFVELTGVDSLAISIGTAHGVYKNNVKPVLNFERLREIAEAVDTPLVLHGGSGSGDDNLARCSREGICKINIFTDFLRGGMNEIGQAEPKDYFALKKAANLGMEKTMRHYLKLLSRPQTD